VLVALGLVEQRYRAVLEVLDDGATVVEVARRYGVARQTVHAWLRRYAAAGLGRLAAPVGGHMLRPSLTYMGWSDQGWARPQGQRATWCRPDVASGGWRRRDTRMPGLGR
jgi:hypothetical protein